MPLIDTLGAAGIVPVVVIDDVTHAVPLAEAVLAGGLNIVEVTLRTENAIECIAAMTSVPGLTVGAGTVTKADDVDRVADAGATFIVSPGLSAAVVNQARRRDIPIMPGVITPSEIMAALDLGLDLLKFFPAGAMGGAATLKALAAPFPGVRFVPTGGVSVANLGDYLAQPAVAAVGGSWMLERATIAAGDFTKIHTDVAAACAARDAAR